MELERIEILLEKYFEAETSVAEENELKSYFSSTEVAEHLSVYQPLFSFTSNAQAQVAHTVAFKPKRNYFSWMNIAASVVVLLSVTFFINQYNEKKKAEYAYNQTIYAMKLLSENFAKAKPSMAYISTFDQTTAKVFNPK